MHWVAPSEKDNGHGTLEKQPWGAADQLRANSGLTSQRYSKPVLGLIFLKFADERFTFRRADLEKAAGSSRRGSRVEDPTAYHAEGVLYLTSDARFSALLNLPEGANVGSKLNEAIADIEKHNPQLARALLDRFERYGIPIRDSILGLRDKIQSLRRMRDLLLPRLLSRQVHLG